MKPELLDVVELLVDLPESAIQAGELGTIVETYGTQAYEVEFADTEGATLALQALEPEQFVVVWKHSTQAWVPLADRMVAPG